MEKKKRNYHKESGYKAQKKYNQKNNYEAQKQYAMRNKRTVIDIPVIKYNRLKELADASNLPVSKFILKTLQKEYPEVFND